MNINEDMFHMGMIYFWVRYIAMRLSYRMEGVEEKGRYNSSSRDLSQHSFTTVLAKALYSTFVEDHVTTRCLKDFHGMRLEPK